MDHFAYLEQKATSAGIKITKAQFKYTSDQRVYLLEKAGRLATVSLSGLEMLQNSKDEQIQDLIDTRFRKALEHLNSPLISDSHIEYRGLGSAMPFGWIATPLPARPLSSVEMSIDKSVITALKQENASLRDHVAALGIEIEHLTRELAAARFPQMSSGDPLPAADCDRIWDALRMAANS